MKKVLFLIMLLLSLSSSIFADNKVTNPIESLRKSIMLAEAGKWDEHFKYTLHTEELQNFEEIMINDKIKFIKLYSTKKIPYHKEMLDQTINVKPKYGIYQKEDVALLILNEPVKSTVAILLFLQNNHYVIKNSSILNSRQLEQVQKELVTIEK